jgi:ribosomal protein S7
MKVLTTNIGKKLLTSFMKKGKKSRASSLVGQAFEYLYKKQPKKKEYIVFHALKRLRPSLEGILMHKQQKQQKKRLGKLRWVSSPLRPNRRQYLSISWLLTQGKHCKGKDLGPNLLASSQETSAAVSQEKLFHLRAKEGRPYSNYRWK